MCCIIYFIILMSNCNNYKNKRSNEYNNELSNTKNTEYDKLFQLNSCIQKTILYRVNNLNIDAIENSSNKHETMKKLNTKTKDIFNYNLSYVIFKLSIFIVLFYYYRIL